jgi:hypothetical protein
MEFKKSLVFVISLIGISLPGSGFAAAFMPPPAAPPKKVKKECPKAKPIIYENSYPHFVYQHPYFYLGAGIGAYHLKNPTVGLQSFTGSSTPIASIDNDGFTPIYCLNAGYAFYNPHDSIFGHFNDIALKFNYFNRTDTKSSGLTGTGDIYYIDGSGAYGTGLTLYSYSAHAKHRLIDTGLYYRSLPAMADLNTFTIHPRVGLVFTNFNAEYNYLLDYEGGAVRLTDKEDYKVKTNYYGVAAGTQLAYNLAPQLLFDADIELQLLHASADLHAVQQPDITDNIFWIVNVTQSKTVTYRAIASLGAKYAFTMRANGISLGAKVGLDRWGYNPKVVTPNAGNGGRRIHLDGTSQNNFFAKLNVTVPLG